MLFLGKFSGSDYFYFLLIHALNQKFFQVSFRLNEQTLLFVYEGTMHEKLNPHGSYLGCLFHFLIASAQICRLRAQREINVFRPTMFSW